MLNANKNDMEQIIKLTTQMANKAITEHIVTSIIREANAQKDAFDFDTFFTPENLNEIFNQKMKISEVKNLVGVNGKKKEKKTGKKRMNGYTFFAKNTREELKNDEDFKDATFKDINQELSKRWKALNADEKEEWKKKAANYNNSESGTESENETDAEPEAPKPAPKPVPAPSPEPLHEDNEDKIEEEKPKKLKKLKKKEEKPKKLKKMKKKEEKPKKKEKKSEETSTFTMNDVDDMFD